MKENEPVLIVDDQEHIRTYFRLVCERRLKCPVIEAADGKEALRICGEVKPRLVLLDINMPRMNGIATLNRLRDLIPGTPIVMLTVRASRDMVQECQQAGASAYLRKDTSVEQIFTVLEKLYRGTPESGNRESSGTRPDAVQTLQEVKA